MNIGGTPNLGHPHFQLAHEIAAFWMPSGTHHREFPFSVLLPQVRFASCDPVTRSSGDEDWNGHSMILADSHPFESGLESNIDQHPQHYTLRILQGKLQILIWSSVVSCSSQHKAARTSRTSAMYFSSQCKLFHFTYGGFHKWGTPKWMV